VTRTLKFGWMFSSFADVLRQETCRICSPIKVLLLSINYELTTFLKLLYDVSKKFNFFNIFLYYFDLLKLQIFLNKIKIYYFNIFLNKKILKINTTISLNIFFDNFWYNVKVLLC